MNRSPWVVLKFGGTSVSSAASWQIIAKVVQTRLKDGFRPIVVCSALAGVSDILEQMVDDAASGRDVDPALAELEALHRQLCKALAVEQGEALDEHFEHLRRLVWGAVLTEEATPRLRARILATGEVLATMIGAMALRAQGLIVSWQDARDLLHVEPITDNTGAPQEFLAARCTSSFDAAMARHLESITDDVVLTQGFIARNDDGDTVLLGRGGSDTSAAYFAAKVGASRLEIWTDVPGMFTANPREVPAARLLRQLDYAEAQELASMGAKVLHPRCLAPVQAAGIPVQIRCTGLPELTGTVVSRSSLETPLVKAVTSKKGVGLVSMETIGMWQEPGFLSEAFACFKRHGLSVGLVSTAETNVTVSLDLGTQFIEPVVLKSLMADLNRICQARFLGPAAVVSLVGRGIRSILPLLAPAFERLRDQTVYLISQAANDLNLSFVVEEDRADALVQSLHASFFRGREMDHVFGPRWQELIHRTPAPDTEVESPWWVARREALLAEAAKGTPCFVYDPSSLDQAIHELQQMTAVSRLFFAVKANNHPEIIRRFAAAGLGFDCVSAGELEHVDRVLGGLPPDRVLFTPNFAPREEYARAIDLGAVVTLDSLFPICSWPEMFRDRDLMVRIDPGRGRGHHQYVVTAGAQTKFGLVPGDLEELAARVEQVGARVVGLHAHAGSGILEPENWQELALFLDACAEWFPDVRVLDLGGGLGVAERAGAPALDLGRLNHLLALFCTVHPRYELWLEPGRFLVARAGVLLGRVSQIKEKDGRVFVGGDVGMNTLVRPALYGAWHEIVNLTRLDEPGAITADVVGPICESGDVLGYERWLPVTEEGDILLFGNAGAYGRVMSFQYNLRSPGRETCLSVASPGHLG